MILTGTKGETTQTGETTVFNLMAFLNDNAPQIGGAVSLHTFEGQILTMDLARDRQQPESEEILKRRVAGIKELESRIARPGSGNLVELFVARNRRMHSFPFGITVPF